VKSKTTHSYTELGKRTKAGPEIRTTRVSRLGESEEKDGEAKYI
jgi:hypothetical protein